MLEFAVIYLAILVTIWVRYGVFAGAVHAFVWGLPEDKVPAVKLAAQAPKAKTVWRETRTSLLATVIFAAPASILIYAWRHGGTAIYTETPQTAAGWLWVPASVLLYLVLHDAYFYWTHRWMHHPRLYKWMHHTHHLAKQPTAFASFSFSPAESAVAAWFVPALAFVVPIHAGAFMFVLTFATVTAVCNHCGWEMLPLRWLDSFVGRHIITARHHNLHHTRFSRNYGLYFRWWDQLCGTESMIGDPAARHMPERRPASGALATAKV